MNEGAAKRIGTPQPLFVAGDVDGFFGLAIDNLIQFLLILGLCTGVLGFPMALLLGSVLPGAALSVAGRQRLLRLAGAEAVGRDRAQRRDRPALRHQHRLAVRVRVPGHAAGQARRRGRRRRRPTQAALLAWRVGLAACFLCGVIELVGAPVADWVRRSTPRAALLSTLSGIAISFIAIDFAVRTFADAAGRAAAAGGHPDHVLLRRAAAAAHPGRRLGGARSARSRPGCSRWCRARPRRSAPRAARAARSTTPASTRRCPVIGDLHRRADRIRSRASSWCR